MKKKGIVIALIIVLVLIVGFVCTMGYYQNKEKTKNEENTNNNNEVKKDCMPFTGGSYNLVFDTDGGTEIESMSVCIACSPDSYEDIPIPEKEGYTFDGWYSDKKLTKKIDYTNTKDIKAIPEYDEDKCMIGYKDITLYASWSDVQLRVEEEENNNTVGSSPSSNYGSSVQSSGGNNGSQPVQEVIPDYPMPPAHTTKVYKPITAGILRGGYGRLENNSPQLDVLFQITGGDRNIYPINDGIVLGYTRLLITSTKSMDYIVYKTNIDGNNYYVMYSSYYHMIPSRDYSDITNLEVSYNNPLVKLSYDTDFNNTVPGCFRVKMIPAFVEGGISNEVGQFRNIIATMAKNTNPVNPNQFFKLNQGESFNER